MATSRISRRFIIGAGLVAALGLAPMASASAAATTPATSVVFSGVNCSITITYSWSGFHGGNLTPRVVVNQGTISSWGYSLPSTSGKSGEVSHTFELEATGGTDYSFSGTGYLMKANGAVLSGSEKTSESHLISCQIPLG